MVSLPYTQELNDLGMILIQGHRASEYADRAIDQFDQLLADSAEATRVMCFTLHPYIMGAPHRARHVRRILEHVCRRSDVKVWTGEQILDWYTACRGIDTRPTPSACSTRSRELGAGHGDRALLEQGARRAGTVVHFARSCVR